MIDKNKEYTTRDGREVRIYATDGNRSFPVHGAVREHDGWSFASWTCTGNHDIGCGESEHDLIEKPKVIEGYINIYKGGRNYTTLAGDAIWPTREAALGAGDPEFCVAMGVYVKFTEGEGKEDA